MDDGERQARARPVGDPRGGDRSGNDRDGDDVLGSPSQLGGDGGVCGRATADKERRLGVPLIPGRAGSRSFEMDRSGDERAAPARRAMPWVGLVAATFVVAAAARGLVPLPAASTIVFLAPAAVIDLDERRLPDVWIAGALLALVVSLALASALDHDMDIDVVIVGAITGSVAMTLPLLALHLVSPAAMGFGDVKAVAVLGAALGSVDWRLATVALCGAALSGSTAGLVGRRQTIAFGPHLVIATLVVLVAREPIIGLMFDAGSIS
jgi:leader peptidase (prepilin peptidase)/N-methyltransferase